MDGDGFVCFGCSSESCSTCKKLFIFNRWLFNALTFQEILILDWRTSSCVASPLFPKMEITKSRRKLQFKIMVEFITVIFSFQDEFSVFANDDLEMSAKLQSIRSWCIN